MRTNRFTLRPLRAGDEEALFREYETTHKGLCDVAIYGLLASDARPSK